MRSYQLVLLFIPQSNESDILGRFNDSGRMGPLCLPTLLVNNLLIKATSDIMAQTLFTEDSDQSANNFTWFWLLQNRSSLGGLMNNLAQRHVVWLACYIMYFQDLTQITKAEELKYILALAIFLISQNVLLTQHSKEPEQENVSLPTNSESSLIISQNRL